MTDPHRERPPAEERRTRLDLADYERAMAKLESIRARNRHNLEAYEQYVEQVGDLTGEGYSTDGAIRAEVDRDGILSALDVPDSALRHGSRLGEMILTALREAQAARALKMAELGTRLNGPRSAELVRESIPEETRENIAAREREGR